MVSKTAVTGHCYTARGLAVRRKAEVVWRSPANGRGAAAQPINKNIRREKLLFCRREVKMTPLYPPMAGYVSLQSR